MEDEDFSCLLLYDVETPKKAKAASKAGQLCFRYFFLILLSSFDSSVIMDLEQVYYGGDYALWYRLLLPGIR
jgi:hypothetical protein